MTTATGIWKTDHTPEGLIDLFKTIDPDGYDGSSGASCLIGFPTERGVLEAEYWEFWNAQHDNPTEQFVGPVHWLARRYNVDYEKVRAIYGAVDGNHYDTIDEELNAAVDFAENYLIKGMNLDEAAFSVGAEFV